MRKAVKITLWILGSLFGLILLLFGIAMFLLTPERLTPIVKSISEEYLNASVDFESVDISIFADFPLVKLSLKGTNVISHSLGGSDTLVRFKDFSVSIDALQLMGGRFAIRSVNLTEPTISALIDSAGVASWDILKSSTPDEDTTSTTLDLNINSIKVVGESKIELYDRRDATVIHACWSDMSVSGSLTNDLSRLFLSSLQLRNFHGRISSNNDTLVGSLNLDTLSIKGSVGGKLYGVNLALNGANLAIAGDTLLRDLSFALNGNLYAKRDTFEMAGLRFSINEIESQLDGSLILGDSTIQSDIRFTSPSIALTQAVALIPNFDMAMLSKLHSSISFGINAKIEGSYNANSGALPDMTLNISSPLGALSMDGRIEKLDRFALASTLNIKGGKVNFELDQLNMEGLGISLLASGKVDDLLGDPYFDGQIKSQVDLDILLPIIPNLANTFTASGVVDVEGSGKFRISQLNMASLANTTIAAQVALKRFKFALPLAGIESVASGRFTIGTSANRRDTSMKMGLKVVGLQAILDTVKIKIGNQIDIKGAGLNAWASTAAARYANGGDHRIHPFRGYVSAKRFEARMADSSIYRLRGLDYDFRVTPLPGNDTIPVLTSNLKAASVAVRSGLDRYVLRKMSFTASAQIVPTNKNAISRNRRYLDSLQIVYPHIGRDSLFAHNRKLHPLAVDEMASGDIDMKMGGAFLQLLRRWKAQGTITAAAARIVTPYIPLRTDIKNVDICFTNDRIDLHSFHLAVGRSRMDISGYVSNLKRVMAGRGTLTTLLAIKSDTLDFTQLIHAINSGISSYDAIAQAVDSAGGGADNEEQLAQIIADNTTHSDASNLIIVPKNIALNATLDVGAAIYGSLIMDSLVAQVISRNHTLQIKRLSANSNIGHMSLEAIYSTRSMSDISTGFDLQLKQVQVAQLIDLIPDVDTLLPMLGSFEGVVDCSIAAFAAIDSQMNVIIPSLDAAASIKGRDMVLLDGETFTEISKILRFKNRKRNFVDSISVEMLVKDSKVEIFPFILEIDRYKTAVSGVQHLDMSFDYHISVLKSVVPFRLGVNIYGNLDDWKFKLVKAKYKDEHIPSHSQTIDTMRINLIKEIENIFSR